MTSIIQHYLNPLHIYCRLRNIGLTKGQAVKVCRLYEQIIFKPFIVRKKAGCS